MSRSNTASLEVLSSGFDKLPSVLEELGYDSLKQGQEEAVMNLMYQRDTVCVMPTGFGKSAIYIVPARCLQWKTLIFSPLVSLMKDQVESLWAKNYTAGQVSSGQTDAENNMVLSEWERGEVQYLLVAPERLQNKRFIEVIEKAKPDLVAIDEAHCVSQWADTFRPSYVDIGKFVSEHEPKVVLAMTATMTPDMESDVRRVLSMENAAKIVYYPRRKNLVFENESYSLVGLRNILNSVDGPTIVYCSTKKKTHELYDQLKFSIEGGCLVYNGGMSPDERTTNQNMFMSNDVRVMFATNAFGLGVDKSDIRCIVHVDYPSSVEQYAQEAGRAGRDGKDSKCFFLDDRSTLDTQSWFIETTFPPTDMVQSVFAWLQSVADSSNAIRVTNKNMSKRIGIHEAYVSSCLGVLVSSGVVERDRDTSKICKVKLLRQHPDSDIQDLVSSIEDIGFPSGSVIEFDLDILSSRTGIKLQKLKVTLKELNDNDYLVYIPPYRGSVTRIVGSISSVDFDRLENKAREAHAKLRDLVNFMGLDSEGKHDFLESYFT